MNAENFYQFLADAILISHVLFVLFVVLGLVLIIIGKLKGWSWVTNPWFRLCHLIAISIVVIQSWLGIVCPLTTWEMSLREKAGESVYSVSFIEYWLNKILYFQAPWWIFVLIYTVFGGLVLLSWFWVKPRSFKSS